MNLSTFVNHYKRICKPVVTPESVAAARLLMEKSPEKVLVDATSYHLNDIGLFIKELHDGNPEVLDENALSIYIAHQLMLQEGVLLHYDKAPTYTMSDVLSLSLKVEVNFVDCLAQGENVVTIPTTISIDPKVFDVFYKHYVRYYRDAKDAVHTNVTKALRKVRYESDKLVKDCLDFSTMRLFDIISGLYAKSFRIVDQQTMSLYILWRLYDEYRILLDRNGSGLNCESMIINNIQQINDDMIKFRTVASSIILRQVPIDMMPTVGAGDAKSNAEQMHTLNDIAHYCAEKNIGVLSFISAMFADPNVPADTYLEKIKHGWESYKDIK